MHQSKSKPGGLAPNYNLYIEARRFKQENGFRRTFEKEACPDDCCSGEDDDEVEKSRKLPRGNSIRLALCIVVFFFFFSLLKSADEFLVEVV